LRPSDNAEGVRQLCSFVQAVRIDQLIAPHLTPALPKDELSALMPAEGSEFPFAYGSDGVGLSFCGVLPHHPTGKRSSRGSDVGMAMAR
jgi:hypothetical protein